MHLARRLPAGSYEEAAYAGLQDTAPRAALLSLHARMDDVGPGDWEHPSLVQVWGPRGAAWVVPRSAIAAFTLGRLPRDPDRRRQLEQIADEALAGGPDPFRRAGAATGRYLIRWDTRTTTVLPIDPPDVDPEEARRDLAHRFLHWFGDEMRPSFATWAGVRAADAAATLSQLPAVSLPSRPRAVGVRFLPLFDPYVYGRAPSLPHHAVAGTLLVDGEIVGTWTRQQRQLDVRQVPSADVGRIREEAQALSSPLGGAVTVTFAVDRGVLRNGELDSPFR